MKKSFFGIFLSFVVLITVFFSINFTVNAAEKKTYINKNTTTLSGTYYVKKR